MILLGWGLHSLVYADEHATNPKQQVHDDVKDKEFELELSWVCEESGWTHKQVPKDLLKAAEEAAKAALEEDMDDD